MEFLYQPQKKTFAFLEVNTRLQVEHPITEATTGIDLVKLQILVAAGEPLPAEPPTAFGHAIEARLNAEDADAGFAPAPGVVELLTLPNGPGIRVDTGIATGDVIPPDYDSMVAKIIAWGRDRSEALARLRCALRETTVVLRGGTTTKSFLLELLDRAGADRRHRRHRLAGPGRAAAGRRDCRRTPTWRCCRWPSTCTRPRSGWTATPSCGRPAVAGRAPATSSGARSSSATWGSPTASTVAQISPHRYRVTVDNAGSAGDGAAGTVSWTSRSSGSPSSRAGSRSVRPAPGGHHRGPVRPPGRGRQHQSPGHPRRGRHGPLTRARGGGGDLDRAPAPRSRPVRPLIVLESMKMETHIRAPYAGRVREVLATVNSQIDAGGALLRLDRIESDDAAAALDRRRGCGSPPATRRPADFRAAAEQSLGVLQAMITGYDVTPAQARQALTATTARWPTSPRTVTCGAPSSGC